MSGIEKMTGNDAEVQEAIEFAAREAAAERARESAEQEQQDSEPERSE